VPWDGLTAVGARLFFPADGGGGEELWTSDGTDAGTELVRSLPEYDAATALTAVGSLLFFVAGNADGSANALWVSDGTEAGTRMVADMGPPHVSPIRPTYLTALGDLLVFAVDDGVTGEELWRSDGTALGTYRVGDINPGPASSSPTGLIAVDGTVYFRAEDTEAGPELWGYRP